MATIDRVLNAAAELRDAVETMRFSLPVTHVYNPLSYAWGMHESYIRAFARGRKQVLFLGMNPGPFGMAQTGVPFGEIAAVRDWLRLKAPIATPTREHPRRPIHGLACKRSEVSGRRLWGLFAQRFGTAKAFFTDHFVINYCPLLFVEASGKNRTPDKLAPKEREAIYAACDVHLHRLVEAMQPTWVIGIGRFAAERALQALGDVVRIGHVHHPSPANPSANRDWAGGAISALTAQGIWAAPAPAKARMNDSQH